MALKKAERKEALREVFLLLQNTPQTEQIKAAKEKVLWMLAQDGLFMVNANDPVN